MVTLPKSSSEYQYDPNGSGPKNQFGNLVAGLSALSDPQATTSQAVAKGDLLVLVSERSSDASFQSSPCANAHVSSAKKQLPDFSGNGTFTVDMTSDQFDGAIASGNFASNPAAKAAVPVTLTFQLAITSGGMPVQLPLTAAELHLQGGDSGVLNAVIKKTDLDQKVIPGLAASLNAQIAAAPTSTGSLQLLGAFDNGGAAQAACGATCQNPDGSCAVKGDKKIDPCELGTNALVMNLLSPDVQMFNGAQYQPNPANTMKDSLTFGVSLSLVGAKF
jgi:hypothetical protein